MGGMLSVMNGEARLVATTWEWAEQIDQARAEASKKRAEEILAQKNLDRRDYELAKARLRRALVRTSIRK
jgi:F-type H+-transporting ATPase subunit epsilon